MIEPPRQTLLPRNPRMVMPGPRARRMDLWLVVDVVLIFIAIFVGVLLLGQDRWIPSAALGAVALALGLLDATRWITLRHLRQIAMVGNITAGEVVATVPTRFRFGPRADPRTRLIGRPFVREVRVVFVFLDESGNAHEGSFIVAPNEVPFYPVTRTLEVFYLAAKPARNTTSLVLRWYYRLGGAAITDEAPPSDEFEVAWEDHPDSLDPPGEPTGSSESESGSRNP